MSKVALVTGANRSLGYALVEVLCEKLGAGATVYLGSRDAENGRKAIEQLAAQGLKADLALIDIASDESVAQCAAMIAERHGGIDIVIGNGAMTLGSHLEGGVEKFVRTNNFGTNRLIRAFGPILNDGARFLVVSSYHGCLVDRIAVKRFETEEEGWAEEVERAEILKQRHGHQSVEMSEAVADRFFGEGVTLEGIEAALDEYCALMKAGKAAQAGWPEWVNKPSKVGQIASTFVFARDMRDEARRRDIQINACCPGIVDTEMMRAAFASLPAALPPREAAEDLYWIVSRPAGSAEPYGRMITGREVIPVR